MNHHAAKGSLWLEKLHRNGASQKPQKVKSTGSRISIPAEDRWVPQQTNRVGFLRERDSVD